MGEESWGDGKKNGVQSKNGREKRIWCFIKGEKERKVGEDGSCDEGMEGRRKNEEMSSR